MTNRENRLCVSIIIVSEIYKHGAQIRIKFILGWLAVPLLVERFQLAPQMLSTNSSNFPLLLQLSIQSSKAKRKHTKNNQNQSHILASFLSYS